MSCLTFIVCRLYHLFYAGNISAIKENGLPKKNDFYVLFMMFVEGR